MRILLLGKNGQVGWELQRTLAPLGEVIALGRSEADLCQPEHLRDVVRDVHPQVIVNAAAYTDVDGAESEPDLAMTVNGVAPGMLAEEARRLRAALIHYSTDYVFDGTKGSPYVESDVPNPINVYGKSKLAGEQAIQSAGGVYLILRTSWVYSLRRDNFVTKVLRWAREKETLRIVDDQRSSPTWARILAEATSLVIGKAPGEVSAWLTGAKGVYHLAGSGFTSRYVWAALILDLAPVGNDRVLRQLLPANTVDFPTPAARPPFTALDCSRFQDTFGLGLPAWDAALRWAMQ